MNNQQRQQMPPHHFSSSAATTLLLTIATRLDQVRAILIHTPLRAEDPKTLTRVNGKLINIHRGYLGNDLTEVKLHYIGNDFYLKATVFDGLYSYGEYSEYTKDFESW
eukprot:5811374-Amphidinium_carterae.2